MFDTEALDTLAALCGSAGGSAGCSSSGFSASSSTPPTPLLNTLNRSSTPNYALIAQRQQLQLQDAHHAAMVAHQQQAQAHVGVSTIPSDIEILQAYLARTTAGISTGSGISAIPSPDGLGLAGLSSAANGVNLHNAASSFRRFGASPVNDMYHLEARTMAANIFMTQQRQQWSGQTHLLQQQNSRSPGFTTLDHHLPPVPPVTADTPQYPQAFQSLSPSLHNFSPLSSQLLTANAHSLNNTQPFKVSSQLLPEAKQSHRLVESNREANECPPLKKRLMERRKLDGGVTAGHYSSSSTFGSAMFTWERKKEAKKAANRFSANLSRKRKKMFIEDLQYENQELRRKELILQSIPDLIVVFDSSGCISFASPSVSTFIDYKSDELEETCFWDVLTHESKRMVKSAFMDALSANRDTNVDSSPLCRGDSITIKFSGKKTDEEDEEDCDTSTNSNNKSFLLKGVIHFTGELPECVCSIRSEDAAAATRIAKEVNNISRSNTALSSNGSIAEEAIQQQRRIEVGVTMSTECDALSSEVSDFDSDRDIS